MTISMEPNRTMATVPDGGLGNQFAEQLELEFQKIKGLTKIEISAGKTEDGAVWVRAWSAADNVAAASLGVSLVIDTLAGGKEAYIRRRPMAETRTDFISDEIQHRGYVNFSFYDRAGQWHYVNPKEFIGISDRRPPDGTPAKA